MYVLCKLKSGTDDDFIHNQISDEQRKKLVAAAFTSSQLDLCAVFGLGSFVCHGK